MMTLLPGRGAELPWAGRSLRFGMTLGEVCGSVEPYADLHDTFVCNAAWAREFALDGIRVCLFASRTDALTGVSANRTGGHETSHVPVGLDDIDLFGWPVDEVIDALRDTGRDVRTTRTSARVGGDLHLGWARPPAPVGGTRREPWRRPVPPPAFVDHLCLYAPTGDADDG